MSRKDVTIPWFSFRQRTFTSEGQCLRVGHIFSVWLQKGRLSAGECASIRTLGAPFCGVVFCSHLASAVSAPLCCFTFELEPVAFALLACHASVTEAFGAFQPFFLREGGLESCVLTARTVRTWTFDTYSNVLLYLAYLAQCLCRLRSTRKLESSGISSRKMFPSQLEA